MSRNQRTRKMTINELMLPSDVKLSQFSGSVPLESQQVRVESEILRPISFSDTGKNGHVRYILENKGILSPNSRLTFCGVVGASNYADGLAYYPMLTGGMALIRNVRLMIGNRTIATSQAFNQFFSNQRGLVKSCKRLGVDAVEKLTNDNYRVVANNANNSNNGIGAYTGQVDLSGSNPADVVDFNLFSALDNVADESPTFSVSLKELFPFFTDEFDIPLYLLNNNERVIIHIDLEDEDEGSETLNIGRRSVKDTGNSHFATTRLDENSTKMIVDYVYFSQDKMAEIEQAYRQRGDLASYVDLQLVETSLADTVADSEVEDKVILTGADRVVRGIFMNTTPYYNTGASSGLAVATTHGRYYSYSYNQARGFNLTINNQKLLNTPLSNQKQAENYYYYSTWNGNQGAYIPTPFYMDIAGLSDNHINGTMDQNKQTGSNSPMGISFGNDGYRVNSTPISLELMRKDSRAIVSNRLFCWVLVRRIFSVNKNGSVSVSF